MRARGQINQRTEVSRKDEMLREERPGKGGGEVGNVESEPLAMLHKAQNESKADLGLFSVPWPLLCSVVKAAPLMSDLDAHSR